jgi:hypothetical protein
MSKFIIYIKKGKRRIYMNLLIFFAIPLATILLAIVLEKVLRCPILVAITFFAIYLIVVFALFAAGVITSTNLAEFLIAIIIYTIIAFVTALIVKLIRRINLRFFSDDDSNSTDVLTYQDNDSSCSNNSDSSNLNGNLLKISCRCNNGNSSDLLTVNSNCLGNDSNNNTNTDPITISGNIIPNQSNCGRTGSIRGCYRR